MSASASPLAGAGDKQTATRFRIRLICPFYPPVLGGTEIEAQRVCSALRKKGHDVKVLCMGGGRMPRVREWVDPAGVPVRLYAAWIPERWRDYGYAAGVAWTLFRERRQYEIVYCIMGGAQLATAVPVARWLGKWIVMKFSGSSTIAPLATSRLGRFELRLLQRHAGRVLVLNSAMVEEAREVGFDPAQLGWMPNPVDVEWFRPADSTERNELRRARNLPPLAPVIVFVGRLAPEKELASLFQALAAVSQSRPDAHLALVGDGPLRAELQQMAAGLGLSDRIHFCGAVPPESVCGWLQCADIFTLVSSREGLPCSLLEAMAVGLPAVVSSIPANQQLVEDGVHGCVVPCGDSQAIAQALLRLMDSPQLRQTMGAAGRQQVVAQYATAKVIESYERLFAGLVS